jgi:hypothetical protein
MKHIVNQFQNFKNNFAIKNLSKIVIIITIVLSSCSKPDDTTKVTPNPTTPPTQGTTELVLAAGNAVPLNNPGIIERAIIWRDGVATYLTPTNKNSFAKGFDVLNTSTVVCGTTGFSTNGPDVTKATLWVDTNQIILENNPTEYSVANAVKVSTSNFVYTVGNTTVLDANSISHSVATLWKGISNIQKTTFSTPAEINNGVTTTANAVDVSANEVCVVGGYGVIGTQTKYAVLWKNGIKINLNNGFDGAQALGVEITNGITYVTGYKSQSGFTVAMLWIVNANNSVQEVEIENPTSVPFNPSGRGARGLNVYNTGSITYIYGTNSLGHGAQYSPCYGKLWKYNGSTVVTEKVYGLDEPNLATTQSDIYSGFIATNVSISGPSLPSIAAGFVQEDFLNSSKQTPCYWNKIEARKNIEAVPVNRGAAIGARIL